MQKIAYLGLGTMGQGMAGNLVKAGHPLTVWNRDATRAREFAGAHAEVRAADTPAEAVRDADLILYSLADDAAVEETVFGPQGILAGVRAGQIALDMSTVHPDTSRREADAFGKKGVAFLDTPVFGSRDESAQGGLWILAGGPREAFEQVRPVLDVMGETVHYMGGTGQGAAMKLVGNLIVSAQLQALGEGMVLAAKAGLDPQDVLGVLKVTDFRSPILEGTAQTLMDRDFTPNFALKLLLKDANLIARYAQDLNVPLPAAAATRETIKAAVNQGWGDENASALIKMLEQGAGVTVRK